MDNVCSVIDLALENLAALKVKIEKGVIKAKRDAIVQIENLGKDMFS
jgi:hypothetical protein